MPEQLMKVSYPMGTSLSQSLTAADALSPLLRDAGNHLVGQVVLRPADAPKLGFVLAGVALVGLTVGAVAMAARSRSSSQQVDVDRSNAATSASSRSSAPAGWHVDGFGHHRWWDGQQWTEHVQAPQLREAPPAGWHDDGTGRERWWDGYAWTEHMLPVSQSAISRSAVPAGPQSTTSGESVQIARAAVSMSTAEWQERFRAMVLARQFSDEQWQLLSTARIVDADGKLLSWQSELRGLSAREFGDRVIRAVEANPALATAVDSASAGWYDDGSGHQRWWDGYQWTEHVTVRTRAAAVPIHSSMPAGWYDDRAGRWRWWDGHRWTEHYG